MSVALILSPAVRALSPSSPPITLPLVGGAVALALLLGCPGTHDPDPAPPPTPVERPAIPVPEPEPQPEPEPPPPLEVPSDLTFPPGAFAHEDLLDAISNTPSRLFKPIGTSSLAFRMRLRSEHTAALKPRTRTHREGFLREVAAYRLARILGLENVPPATVRVVPNHEIRDRLEARYDDYDTWTDIQSSLITESNGNVPGASIYWVPELTDLGLDRGTGLTEWREWLSQSGEVPSEQRALCRDLSNMLAFDYLIANWDRFSGGNMQGLASTEDGPRLIIRDHDVALAASISSEIHTRIRDRLGFTERFSRDLIDRVQRLDREAIARALAAEPSHATAPLLSDAQIEGILERRETLLSFVGALIDRWGEDRVLVFD